MRKKYCIIFSALVFLFSFTVSGQNSITLTSENNGQTFELAKSDVLTIRLVSNPSTGYGWHIKTMDENILKQVKEWDFEPESHLLGSPGIHTLRFTGVAQGTTDLELIYHRPWEKDAEPLETFNIKIISKGAYTGDYKAIPPPPPPKKYDPAKDKTDLRLPTSFNWCDEGGCTSIKSQGNCGSCWAFASAFPFECNLLVQDGNNANLSEQYLVSCNEDGMGCGGGWCAFKYWRNAIPSGESEAGAVYEADFPYTGNDGSCNPPHDHYETIDSYYSVSNNVSNIQQAIYDYGAVYCSVCADNDFQYYSGGIFTGPGCSQQNHAICLVGWDDNDGCWILRNEWGSYWGENGYMRIAYGVSGVGSSAAYVIYKGGIDHTAPPSADFTSDLTTVIAGNYVSFSDASTNSPTQWSWTFQSGTPSSSNSANPTVQYNTEGTYNVSLTATNQYGSDTETKNGYITVIGQGGGFSLDFEACADYSSDFSPWISYEGDGLASYGSSDCDFPGESEAFGFMAFNPSDAGFSLASTHGGDRCGMAICPSDASAADDWIISPKLQMGTNTTISFWVLSPKPGTWGNNSYNVKVSTTGTDPSDFSTVSGGSNEEAPDSWTYREYDLSNWDNQEIHVGIQDASADKFMFWVDDIEISTVTNINDNLSQTTVSVYPNPSKGIFNLDIFGNNNAMVNVVNIQGQQVFAKEYDNIAGKLETKIDLSEYAKGIYYLTVITNDKVFNDKIIVE